MDFRIATVEGFNLRYRWLYRILDGAKLDVSGRRMIYSGNMMHMSGIFEGTKIVVMDMHAVPQRKRRSGISFIVMIMAHSNLGRKTLFIIFKYHLCSQIHLAVENKNRRR
jgi:hypothetical protein